MSHTYTDGQWMSDKNMDGSYTIHNDRNIYIAQAIDQGDVTAINAELIRNAPAMFEREITIHNIVLGEHNKEKMIALIEALVENDIKPMLDRIQRIAKENKNL